MQRPICMWPVWQRLPWPVMRGRVWRVLVLRPIARELRRRAAGDPA